MTAKFFIFGSKKLYFVCPMLDERIIEGIDIKQKVRLF